MYYLKINITHIQINYFTDIVLKKPNLVQIVLQQSSFKDIL